MSKVKFADLFAVILCVIPFIAWVGLRDTLPDNVPIHWGIDGQPNGWVDKGRLPWVLALISGLGIMVYLLLRFIRDIDPKRNAQLNEGIAIKIGIGILTVITALNLLILIPKSNTFNITSTVFVGISLLFAFLGNLMYNIKPNYFIGIRLPWTLENEDNWKQTHRLAGIIWFVGGLLCAIMALVVVPKLMFAVFIGTTILLVLIPSIYSFMLFRRTRNHVH